MMNVSFSDWWCNPENYWTNGENGNVEVKEEEFKNKEGKKIVVTTKSIGLGKYPTLMKMEYEFDGIKETTSNVKKITYDEKLQLFLFEDYMIIGNIYGGAIYYYVDFSGVPVTDSWSNLTDTIYDKTIFWKYEENLKKGYSLREPWLYGYTTGNLHEMISKELDNRNNLQRKKILKKLERRKNYENSKC